MRPKPTSVNLSAETLERLNSVAARLQKDGRVMGPVSRSRLIEMALREGLDVVERRYWPEARG